jgi:rhodanese-related sulfurtransferase/DNA-binding transcriptional ArsR family regulator
LNVIEARRSAALSHYGELARIGKALASPVRLRLLDLLRHGSRTVDALADAAGVSVANSSQHLQLMRRTRLVEAEREGRFVKYRLSDEGVSRVFAAVRDLAEALLPEMDRLRRDLGAVERKERAALLALIARGDVTLLDVRPADEYRSGHLAGARSIPLPELGARHPELPRDREVVAYCRGPYCSMAIDAVAVLRSCGYRARHLDLGVPDLRARGPRIAEGDDGPPRRRSRAAPGPRSRSGASTPSRTTRNER